MHCFFVLTHTIFIVKKKKNTLIFNFKGIWYRNGSIIGTIQIIIRRNGTFD